MAITPYSLLNITDSGNRSINAHIRLFTHSVQCGFPSPADDFSEDSLDLSRHLIKHPAATYFAKAEGDSMTGLGIYDGDLLVVDRALSPSEGSVVIISVAGELTCKLLDIRHNCLRSANPAYSPIIIPADLDAVLEGVVAYVIHDLRKHKN